MSTRVIHTHTHIFTKIHVHTRTCVYVHVCTYVTLYRGARRRPHPLQLELDGHVVSDATEEIGPGARIANNARCATAAANGPISSTVRECTEPGVPGEELAEF